MPNVTRDQCIECVMAHISKARVLLRQSLETTPAVQSLLVHLERARILLGEVRRSNDYADHLWLAIAHLAEAHDEIAERHPDLGERIRALQKTLEREGAFSEADEKLRGLVLDAIRVQADDAAAEIAIRELNDAVA